VSGTSPALGETTQFTATATLSNAATQDVTAQATWQSSNAGVATVSSAGVVRSVAPGEADITGTYSGVSGSKHVSVAPAPTRMYSVSGVITDGSTGRPIVELAEAQVMDGENAGKAGRVDANGVYSIPDLAAGTFTLRARATGYESRDHQVTLDAADVRVDFTLRAQSQNVPCAYSITPETVRLSATGGGFSLTIKRTSGSCAWTATTDARWISLASSTGNGDATVAFTYTPNESSTARSGVIRIDWSGGSANFGMTQVPSESSGELCLSTITIGGQTSRTPQINVSASGGQFTASIQPPAGVPPASCGAWAASGYPLETISFTGLASGSELPGSVTFTVAPNTSPLARTVYVVINFMRGFPSAVLSVNQSGR
jgi:hypothetical protein